MYTQVLPNDILETPNWIGDYLSDTLFHGLRSVLGPDIIDFPRLPHVYKGYPLVDKMYGRGFTVGGKLDEIDVDYENIEEKIKNGFFDYVFINLHHRLYPDWELAKRFVKHFIQHFDKKHLIIFDGNDEDKINSDLIKFGTIFKRELTPHYYSLRTIHPISFSIPKELIVDKLPAKELDFAPLVPSMGHWPYYHLQRANYKYLTEQEYYKDYQRSYFALTCKKGGYDCLRHYEILANGCVPVFLGLQQFPETVLISYPKNLCLSVLNKKYLKLQMFDSSQSLLNTVSVCSGHIDKDIFDETEYNSLANELLDYTKKHLTTEAMANYVLQRIV